MMTSKCDVIALSTVDCTDLKEYDRETKETVDRRREKELVAGCDEFRERDTVDDIDRKSGELSDADAILDGEPRCDSDEEFARQISRSYDFDTEATRDMVLIGCSESQFAIVLYGSFISDAFSFMPRAKYFIHYAFFTRNVLISNVRISMPPPPSRNNIKELRIANIRIDESKYAVRIRPQNGVVTLRWRWGERDDRQERFDRIASFIQENNSGSHIANRFPTF